MLFFIKLITSVLPFELKSLYILNFLYLYFYSPYFKKKADCVKIKNLQKISKQKQGYKFLQLNLNVKCYKSRKQYNERTCTDLFLDFLGTYYKGTFLKWVLTFFILLSPFQKPVSFIS